MKRGYLVTSTIRHAIDPSIHCLHGIVEWSSGGVYKGQEGAVQSNKKQSHHSGPHLFFYYTLYMI